MFIRRKYTYHQWNECKERNDYDCPYIVYGCEEKDLNKQNLINHLNNEQNSMKQTFGTNEDKIDAPKHIESDKKEVDNDNKIATQENDGSSDMEIEEEFEIINKTELIEEDKQDKTADQFTSNENEI